MIEIRKNRGRLLLLLILALLSFSVWWILIPLGKFRYHLVLTGISKGHITPYVARFAPYQDKKMAGTAYAVEVQKKLIEGFNGDPYNVLSIGGEISGSPEAYFTGGKAILEALNFLNLDGMLVGNIEFSFGVQALESLSKIAKFPFISSNIVSLGGNQPPQYLFSEKILTPQGNLKIAVLGITPPQTPEITAKGNTEGLQFLPPGKQIKDRVQAIRAGKVDLVVLLSQYNKNSLNDSEWELIKDIHPDVLIMVDFNVDAPLPMMRDGIIIKTVSGYNQGKEFDVLSMTISGYPRKIAEVASRRIPIFCEDITPNQKVSEELDRSLAEISTVKAEKVGNFASDLERQYDKECPIGNLITDCIREYFKGEIGFQNSGGIQSNIKKGDMTLGDLYNILPFDNEAVSMELYGQEIRELLTISSSLKRGALQVSGCTYSFSNRSVDDFELKDVLVNGSPLVGTQSYMVVTNGFLADGGDGYKTFKRGRSIVMGPLVREVVRGYLKTACASGPIEPKTEGRIQRD